VHKRLVIAAIALGAFACRNRESSYPSEQGGQDTQEQPPSGENEAQAQGTPEEPVKEVVKDPPYGERITVEGKVDQVFGDQVFTMKAPLFQNDLLVVAPKSLTFEALVAPDEVEVTGEVRKMVVSEVERELSVTFDNAVKVKWEERPFVVAESIERVGKRE
jgi:hypothetical protein